MKKSLISSGLAAILIIAIAHTASHAFVTDKTPVREVNVGGRYSMKVPEYLTEGDDLNDEATLQYQNIYKEVYVIVIEEPAQDFIDVFTELQDYDTTRTVLQNYARAQMESIRSNVEKVTFESPERSLKTGCGNAIVYDVAATQFDVSDEMGFTVGFIHGRLNLYMIMTWTFNKDKAKYQADMDAMIVSFKELSGAIAPPPSATVEYSANGVNINNLYSVQVAPGMKLDTSLNQDASLEFSDYGRELYILVIDEVTTDVTTALKETGEYDSKKSPFDNYATSQRQSCASGMKSTKELTGFTNATVNGLQTKTFTIRGYLEGIEDQIFYKIRLVEGKDHVYMIMTWTLASNREANEKDMDAMLNSFREL